MAHTGGQFDVIGGAGYWMKMVKCQDACPVHTDACGYVNAIAEGRDQDAYRIARATNPFASICGRVCGAPCEANCRRGSLDSPVSIRALKRFVTEQFGPETGDFTNYREGCNQEMLPQNRGEFERVAVVGAGVAGLTVAHDLVQLGYKVTVFEAYSSPGGMLTAGVPVFRLPRELVMSEIDAILSLGVELKCNQRLGRDFTINSLRQQGFKAIFLGVGLPKGRKLDLPGADLAGVYDGMDFLRAFNEGNPLPVGKRIIVIGGGNVAYDVARSAVRPQDSFGPASPDAVGLSSQDSFGPSGTGDDVHSSESVAYDVARSAVRMSGEKQVHVVCLENRKQMPADEIEVTEGAEEGLVLHNSRGPPEEVENQGKDKSDKSAEAKGEDQKEKKPQVWTRTGPPTFARVYVGAGNSLELVSMHVSVTVDGPRARTLVDHVFRNPHPRQLEGTFEYPLPTGASPSYFAMFLGQSRPNVPPLFVRRGEVPALQPEALAQLAPAQLVRHVDSNDWGRLQEARVVSTQKALETYEEVVRGRIDPALLEYAGGNTFRGRVFPIPPNGYNRVLIAYEETLTPLTLPSPPRGERVG